MRDYIKNKSVQDSIVVLALGLALGIFSVYSFFNSKVKAAWIMSPYLFPMLIAIFAIAMAYCLFMEGKHQVDAEKAGGEAAKADPIKLKSVVVVVVLSIIYYVLMRVITFIPATILFLAALMWFMGERRWKVLIPVAIIAPLVIYAIFAWGLSVRLP